MLRTIGIIHGENDIIIPAAYGRELYVAFSGPKQIEPHMDHNDLFMRFMKENSCRTEPQNE